jgi:hypothetical protein
VLGTDTGLFYSADAGDHWQPLKSNFPTVPVYDLKIIKATEDLVVATHGRGLFVLDNIRPIEQMSAKVQESDFQLLGTTPGTLFHHWRGAGGGGGFGAGSVPNAPEGVVVDYFLKKEIEAGRGGGGGRGGPGGGGAGGAGGGGGAGAAMAGGQGGPGEGAGPGGPREGPVKIVFTDEHGNLVATEHGTAHAGVNRFVWQMRYDGPERLSFERQQEMSEFAEFFGRGRGPTVVAGKYHMVITVGDHKAEADVEVRPDPNVKMDPENFRASLRFALEGRNAISALNTMLNRVDAMQKSLTAFQTMVRSSDDNDLKKKFQPLMTKAFPLARKLRTLKDSVYNSELQQGSEDDIHYLAAFNSKLSELSGGGAFAYGEPPTQLAMDQKAELLKELDEHLAEFNKLIQTDVPAFNKDAYAVGAPTLYAGDPISVKKLPPGI